MDIEVTSKVWVVETDRPVSMRNHLDKVIHTEEGNIMYAAKMSSQLGDKILLFDRTHVYPMLTEGYCKASFRLIKKEDDDLMKRHFQRVRGWKIPVNISFRKVKKG